MRLTFSPSRGGSSSSSSSGDGGHVRPLLMLGSSSSSSLPPPPPCEGDPLVATPVTDRDTHTHTHTNTPLGPSFSFVKIEEIINGTGEQTAAAAAAVSAKALERVKEEA